MKVSMLALANRHVATRESLLLQIQCIADMQNPRISVTIHSGGPMGSYPQDDTIVALVRPVIERELRARLASIDEDLRALGVTID